MQYISNAPHPHHPIQFRALFQHGPRQPSGEGEVRSHEAVADFVQSIEADLLVVRVPRTSDYSFPSNLAWITDVIPCNLWVLR